MPLDDELPQPPTAQEGGPPAVVEFDAGFDATLLGDVPGMNDPIPQGTYAYRLSKYVKELDKENLPRFAVQWSCQEEPHTGRILRDYIQWVDQATIKAALDPTAVNCMEARQQIKKRMPRAKSLMAAAGYTPVGHFDFETDFLAHNPEVKIPTTVSERKNKDERREIDGTPNPNFGKYVLGTGDMQNGIPNSYLPLMRPA